MVQTDAMRACNGGGRRGGRRPGSRGPVALEFALVMPIFLLLISMMIVFGEAMWARMEMLNFATSTARLCTMTLPVNQASIGACATREYGNFQQRSPMRWCTLSGPVLTTTAYSLERPSDPARPNLFLAQVAVSCAFTNLPFARVGQAVGYAGFNQPFSMNARATMPYMPTFTAGP